MKENLPQINPVKSEHLKDGEKPIIACVGTFENFSIDDIKSIQERFNFHNPNTHAVNFYAQDWEIKNKGFLGEKTEWVISRVDNLDKFSESYFNCTGLLVVGKDKETKQNISFLTHQDPFSFLHKTEKFIKEIETQLKEIKDRCEKGSIDAVLIGGNYNLRSVVMPINERKKDYLASIDLLSNITKKELGFEPVVINGPKNLSGGDNAYFQNSTRRLYFMRPDINNTSKDFSNSGVHEEKTNWEKEEEDAIKHNGH